MIAHFVIRLAGVFPLFCTDCLVTGGWFVTGMFLGGGVACLLAWPRWDPTPENNSKMFRSEGGSVAYSTSIWYSYLRLVEFGPSNG